MIGKKTGGRVKGTPNKWTHKVEEIAAQFNVDPFEVLMMVAAGDWEGLELKDKDSISLSDRIQAAKEAAKYLHSQKQSVAISTGDSGIKIIIEDYANKNGT